MKLSQINVRSLGAKLGPAGLLFLGVALVAVLAAVLPFSRTWHVEVPVPGSDKAKVAIDAKLDLTLVRMCRDVSPPSVPGTQRLISPRGSTWPSGTTLRVRFLEGSERTRRLSFAAISEWSKVCNVRFARVESGPAEIRVSYRPGWGSWSYIGIGSRYVAADQPTMNLGWLGDGSDPSEFYVATHEAGHALGFAHEQSSPNARIPWDVAKVYAYFRGAPNYWDPQTIYSNVLARYRGAEVIAGPYDRDSIMQYPVDDALTVGRFAIGWNTRISAGDSQMARALYPFPGDRGTTPASPDSSRSTAVPACRRGG